MVSNTDTSIGARAAAQYLFLILAYGTTSLQIHLLLTTMHHEISLTNHSGHDNSDYISTTVDHDSIIRPCVRDCAGWCADLAYRCCHRRWWRCTTMVWYWRRRRRRRCRYRCLGSLTAHVDGHPRSRSDPNCTRRAGVCVPAHLLPLRRHHITDDPSGETCAHCLVPRGRADVRVHHLPWSGGVGDLDGCAFRRGKSISHSRTLTLI